MMLQHACGIARFLYGRSVEINLKTYRLYAPIYERKVRLYVLEKKRKKKTKPNRLVLLVYTGSVRTMRALYYCNYFDRIGFQFQRTAQLMNFPSSYIYIYKRASYKTRERDAYKTQNYLYLF